MSRKWTFIFTFLSLFLLVSTSTDTPYTQKEDVEHSDAAGYASISIVDDSNTQITTATIGDLVRIRINKTITSEHFYTIGIKGCEAYDGNPSLNHAKYYFRLIGSDGCNNPPSFYDPFAAAQNINPYNGMNVSGGLALSDSFKIFKFPGVDKVWFKCRIYFCIASNDDECVHNCPTSKRRRRSVRSGNQLEIDARDEVEIEIGDGTSTSIIVKSKNNVEPTSLSNLLVDEPNSNPPCELWERYLTYGSVVLSGLVVGMLFAFLKNQANSKIRKKKLIAPLKKPPPPYPFPFDYGVSPIADYSDVNPKGGVITKSRMPCDFQARRKLSLQRMDSPPPPYEATEAIEPQAYVLDPKTLRDNPNYQVPEEGTPHPVRNSSPKKKKNRRRKKKAQPESHDMVTKCEEACSETVSDSPYLSPSMASSSSNDWKEFSSRSNRSARKSQKDKKLDSKKKMRKIQESTDACFQGYMLTTEEKS